MLDHEVESLESLLVVFVAGHFGILLSCLGHELCKVVLFRLGDGFWLWEWVGSGSMDKVRR